MNPSPEYAESWSRQPGATLRRKRGLSAKEQQARAKHPVVMRISTRRPSHESTLAAYPPALPRAAWYFADLLSLIESGEPTELYRPIIGEDGEPQLRRGVEPTLQLPPNLFVIGTVNVDKTT